MIPYTIRTSRRARYVRITIRPDASVVITAPQKSDRQTISDFIEKHTEWIEQHVHKMKKRSPKVLLPAIAKKDISLYRSKSLNIAINKLKEFNRMYNFSWNSIFIRNQKTRWGSCSSQKNIS